MDLDGVGTIAAERELELVGAGGEQRVRVVFGVPRPIPGSTDACCPYRIFGLGDDGLRHTEGVDGAQALYLAFEAAGTWLETTAAFREGRLTWCGEPTTGLPARDRRSFLRLAAG